MIVFTKMPSASLCHPCRAKRKRRTRADASVAPALQAAFLDLRFGHAWKMALALLGLTVFVGFIAGICLPRFRLIEVLQGTNVLRKSQRAPLRMRAVLVVARFLVAITFIIATLVITEQLQFIQSNRLGFDKEHLAVIPVREDKVQKNFEAVQHSLAASLGIVIITALSNFAW